MPHHGSVQGQAGWVFEQPDLMKNVPAHGTVVASVNTRTQVNTRYKATGSSGACSAEGQ